MNKYGHFSDNGLEYIITDPHPPRDWFNYFWNSTYLASASQNMNGNSLYQNEEGVVTNLMGKQDMREDPRWIYIRDNKTGELWSAGYLPCLTNHDEFECRHGLGYTILRTLKNDIRVEFRMFVPRKYSCEIWTISITNESRKLRDISIFTLSNVMLDGINMPYGYVSGLCAEYLKNDNMLFFKNMTHTVVNEKYRGFVSSDIKPNRWDVSKDYFLGKTKNYACPEKIMDGKLGNSVASAEYMVAALQYNMKLKPKATKTINQILGIVIDTTEARKMKRAFNSNAKIEKELTALTKENTNRLGELILETPDNNFNRLFSVWLKHQLYLMSDWARFYFKGYRDTCQDSAGMSIINTDRAIAMLKKALRNQRSDGFCPRAFRVASMDIAAVDKHYADSPTWISHATDAILRETGDLSVLNEVVKYYDKGKATIWEHNLKALEFLWNDRGAQGLSLVHYGDWNDLMDKVGIKGKGQGIWMSFALARVLKLVKKIALARGDKERAKTCTKRYATLRKAILKYGWDGKHFLYSINDDGMPIGTQKAKEGKIFINPQSWAMLSDIVDSETYTKIAERIEPIVDTPVGPVHNWPAFTKYNPGIGQLTGTPSGFFTNGNVYCHAASFKIAADFKAGRNEKAFETFMKILPSEERSEPYAQVNGYVGPGAMRMEHHVSDDPWRTGTVAWNFLNCVDDLLGFCREIDGVHIKPLIPKKWKKVNYQRPFRGTLFNVQIKRGKRTSLIVDGKAIAGSFIAVPKEGLGKRTVNIICTDIF